MAIAVATQPRPKQPTVALPVGEVLSMAHLHEQAGRRDASERLVRRVLESYPKQPDALHLLGLLAYKANRLDEALACMLGAIEHGVDTPLYWRNIGEVYRVLGRHQEAEAAARRGVALNPADPIALMNHGVVLAEMLRVDESVACFEQALALDPAMPGAHFGLAEALLMRGDFKRGWEEYEWRFRLQDAAQPIPKTDRPQWDGAYLEGMLLLVADQGFGDAIQFGRYIPWAAARAREIALACSSELAPTLAGLHPGLRVFSDWSASGHFAAWCPLTGLPRLAGTTLTSIPAKVPYLHAEADRVARWAARLDAVVPPGLRRVGLVWAGRPTHKNDRKRTIALSDLAPLGALEGTALVVLQKGVSQRQVGGYYGRAPLIHLSAEVTDFRDTMAIMTGLDVVVSIDTSVAHLAGAMGLPVWMMLPWAAEWRWLLARPDSPWYPTMRLFRQNEPGQWAGVVAAVAAALRRRFDEADAAEHRRTQAAA